MTPSPLLWEYLSTHLRELLEDGERIFEQAQKEELPMHDYSYAVFSYAKAYEGFLKKLFYDMGFVSQAMYRGEHFRIGKALNPSLPKELRHDSMYHKIVLYCGGKDLAMQLWLTWKKGRNLVFHYFPHNFRKLTLPEALAIRDEIITAMEKAIEGCSVVSKDPH